MRLSCDISLLLTAVALLISASATFAVRLDVAILGEDYDDCYNAGYVAYPESIDSDTCLFNAQWGFYTIIQEPNNTAKMLYGCEEGCAEAQCTTNISAPFGSCVLVNVNGRVLGKVLARRVLTDYTLGIKVFAGSSCDDFITDYGTIKLKSGACIQSPFEDHIKVSYVNPADAPASYRLTWRARCKPGCLECADGQYGDTALGRCTSFGNSYVTIATTSGAAQVGSSFLRTLLHATFSYFF